MKRALFFALLLSWPASADEPAQDATKPPAKTEKKPKHLSNECTKHPEWDRCKEKKADH